MEKRKALCHPYPKLKEKIEEYGYDGKQLSHCARLYLLLADWMHDYHLGVALRPNEDDAQMLKNFKRQLDVDGNPLTVERAIELCDAYNNLTQGMKERFCENHKNDARDEGVINILNKVKADVIRIGLKRR